MKNLIGKVIRRVFINQRYLKFETDKGDICYEVIGDCCSVSYFYDFIGIDKIINKKVIDFKEVDIDENKTDIVKVKDSECGDYIEMKDKLARDAVILVYGYAVTVQDPDFDELTAVVSFRNASNGYYGGHIMQVCGEIPKGEKLIEIKDNYIID